MDVETERQDNVLSVLVSGRIDGSNAAAFEETVKAAMEESDRAVVMDLEKLSYISSAGLRILLMIAKNLASRDGKLALCALSEPIREVIEISGFDKIIPVHGSRADALASVSA